MKISTDKIKLLIKKLGYKPENGTDGVYFKKYSNHNNYIIKINFNDEKIEYKPNFIDENEGIHLGDVTTSNFENSENFVVLECVDRLLEKGYAPEDISLEYKFPLGRELKGKLDILIFDSNEKAFMMIECKTWGTEFVKEQKKMLKNGGQLFSYYVQDKSVKYLCLYASRFSNDDIEYINDVIKVDKAWIELNNTKEIFDHWNKNSSDNGIFEEWATPYKIEIKNLVRGRLKPISKDDSSRIFNQFAEILRHNVVSDKPNAFNKILNLFICKIYDENKNDDDEVEFQWRYDDTNEKLQNRLNDLYKNGMMDFLGIDVTDYSSEQISAKLSNINDENVLKEIQKMFVKLRLQKNPEFAFIEVFDDNSFEANACVVKEVVELLQPYQFRYGHKQQFLGDFFELLLNTSIKQEAGQFFTPVPITRYIISCLPIKEFIEEKMQTGSSEILPFAIDYATGSGHFLTEYMDKVQTIIENLDISKAKPTAKRKLKGWADENGKFEWAKEYVYGIEADYRLVKTTKVSSFLNGDGEANIIRGNGLDHFTTSKDYRGKLKEVSKENQKDNAQFDILIANPPYSVSAFKSTLNSGGDSFDLYNRLTDSSSEIECLFVERTKQLLKVGGRAGIVLPSSILSNSGIYIYTREILLKYFYIKAITEFGTNTFMATGTNTVTLFLQRRANTDWESIHNAIEIFFERPKDITVLGIEKAFSKYVIGVYEGIFFADYISFALRKPNEKIKQTEIYEDYILWFNNLTEIKNLKNKKVFQQLSDIEQKKKLDKMFFDKVSEIEKEKMLYFLLAYNQKVTLVKVGEKQAEKDFIGYEFSNRRGHEGIKMSPNGSKLYDEHCLNPEKANYYVYNSFMNENVNINGNIKENIFIHDLVDMMEFIKVEFNKRISINYKKKIELNSKFEMIKLSSVATITSGQSPEGKYYNAIAKGIPFYQGKTEFTKKFLAPPKKWTTKITKKAYKDDIVMSVRAPVGPVNIVTEDICIGRGLAAIKCNNLMKQMYLFYILNDMENYIVGNVGTSFASITKNEIEQIKIPFPPLNIQQKIIDEITVIEQTEKENYKKIKELKSYLLKPKYFTYSEQRIDKITTMVQRGKSAKYGKSNIQIIKSGQARGFTEFDFSVRHYVTEGFISDERNLIKGDILINSSGVGTAGRVTLFDLDGDFVVDSHITILRVDKTKALPKYILYALANLGFKTIEKMATGQSGQIELSLATVNNIRLPLPSLEEQNKIVMEIQQIEEQLAELKRQVINVYERKKNVLIKYLQ